jgi:hypothetical protein
MAGTTGIRSFAKIRSQMPWIATTGITPWQTTLSWAAYCQALPLRLPGIRAVRSGLCQSALKLILQSAVPYGYCIRGNPRSKRRGLPQSTVHISVRCLARD